MKKEYPLKVLQFGAGNFLRAFLNYIIEVLNSDTDFNGSALVIKPTSGGDYRDLVDQQGKFNLLQEGYYGEQLKSETLLIDNIKTVINPYTEYERYLESARIPSLQLIVSNTTEAGIRFDEGNSVHDRPAKEYPAKLTQWLFERFNHFKGDQARGCYILPCELIENNGTELKKCILQYASLWNLGHVFEDWIENHNIFYNTLVDRIVSGYPKKRARELERQIGYHDKLLVASEYYLSWVIEGPDSIKKVIPVDKTELNIKLVDDLKPFREIKVRVLNGAHTALVPVAYLYGIDLVRSSLEDALLRRFLEAVVYQDICPMIKMKPEEIEIFAQSVFERFSNPFIDHELLSISLNSISKFKTRLLPTLLETVQEKEMVPKHIVFSLSALIIFYKGIRGEESIPLKDEAKVLEFFKKHWNSLGEKNISYRDLCQAFLSNQEFWDQDLSVLPDLLDTLSSQLRVMDTQGMKSALQKHMNQ